MSTRNRVLMAGPLMISTGFSAYAQTSAEPNEVVLDTIVVEGNEGNLTDNVEGYAAEAAITGTRGLPADVATTPRSVSVITSQQFDDQGATTVEEAISYTPGVTAQTFGLDGRYDQFAIRGFEVQNSNSYRDGMPMRLYGFAGWRTETFGLERIEVLRGPTSSLYGAAQPGGLVNSITKRPKFVDSTELYARASGYGGLDLGVDINTVVSDELAYRLVFLGGETGTQYDETDQGRVYFAPSVTWSPTDATNLSVFAQYQRDEVPDSYVLVPQYGSQLPNPGMSYDNEFYTNNPSRNDIETTQSYVGYELDHEFGDGFTFRSRARYADNDWTNKTGYAAAFFSTSTLPFLPQPSIPGSINAGALVNFDVDNSAKQATFDNAISKELSFGNVHATVIAGLDYYHSDYDGSQSYAFGGIREYGAGNIFGLPGVSNDPLVTNTISQEIKQTGLYLLGNFEIGSNLIIDAGLRHDWLDISGEAATISATPLLPSTSTDLDNKQNFTSGNLGASYNFNNGISVYGALARSFNLPPSGVDASGAQLNVEHSQSWEVGAKFRPLGTNSLLSIAYYDIAKKDTPQAIAGRPGAFEQVGEVRSKGIEVGVNYAFANGLSVLGAYNYIDAKITKNASNQGNRLARIPEHSASLWLAYDVAQVPGLRVGAGARYIGERFSDNANSAEFEVSDVTVFDASVTYERNGWVTTLAARNLADNEYVSYCQIDNTGIVDLFPFINAAEAGGCAYGAARSIELTLSRRF
ncbi:iron complex outermembrane recepter protein [Ruegeria halocynthiae]|uniref:Iron complex outermembrane recepter protein n=1 Tax=Ruegeria halocynthiae TaxID=985054 RepID=A0A1H2XYE2_9RHOB|nr:TonB-dependent siderophore receptor [Ruegeria halocynthiae]SDW97897.1 iron complex outermembrane recepter protein [Ruegeria halocynthiae]